MSTWPTWEQQQEWLRQIHAEAEEAKAEREARKLQNGHHSETSVVNIVPSCVVSTFPKAPTTLEPEALYGLPGDVVRTIEPHTESDPAALLASFLIGAGVLLGFKPRVYRDGASHKCNEFAVLVGLTAKGRKGTSTRRVGEVFRALFPDPALADISQKNDMFDIHDARAYEDFLLSGLGSGEGLIAALAEGNGHSLVFEEEFSKPLKVMRREGSILSETLRAAWDGGLLSNRTKAKQIHVYTSHVGILGHITEQELRLQLSATDVFNGFANRFLWFVTQRSKSLPFGGGHAPIAPLVDQLHKAMEFADRCRPGGLEFNEAAKRIWAEGGVYDLLIDRPTGMLGAVTSRAEAHVTRLALLYSVLDCCHVIAVDHLMAALAVWDYSEKSCAYIFGTSTGDEYADRIDELLTEASPGGVTRTEIRDHFGRNAAVGRIAEALGRLKELGRADFTKHPAEKGRPTEVWFKTSLTTHDGTILTTKSPLQRARELTQGDQP